MPRLPHATSVTGDRVPVHPSAFFGSCTSPSAPSHGPHTSLLAIPRRRPGGDPETMPPPPRTAVAKRSLRRDLPDADADPSREAPDFGPLGGAQADRPVRLPSIASGRAERWSRCQWSCADDDSLFGDDGDDQLHGDNLTDTRNSVFDSGTGNDTCDDGVETDTAVKCETLTGTRGAAQTQAALWHGDGTRALEHISTNTSGRMQRLA